MAYRMQLICDGMDNGTSCGETVSVNRFGAIAEDVLYDIACEMGWAECDGKHYCYECAQKKEVER